MKLKIKLQTPQIGESSNLKALINMVVLSKTRQQPTITYKDNCYNISINNFKQCRLGHGQIIGYLAERVIHWLYTTHQNKAEIIIEKV